MKYVYLVLGAAALGAAVWFFGRPIVASLYSKYLGWAAGLRK